MRYDKEALSLTFTTSFIDFPKKHDLTLEKRNENRIHGNFSNKGVLVGQVELTKTDETQRSISIRLSGFFDGKV